MHAALASIPSARVLVAGDIMLDRYIHGTTSRISPEAPVPVVQVTRTETRPGGAANVALNVAALGASARVAGIVGADDESRHLATQLRAAGVDCRFHQDPVCRTITKSRVISHQQQLIRLDHEAGFDACDHTPLSRTLADALEHCSCLVLSDYGKGTLRDAPELISAARNAGLPVLVDPKRADYRHYRGATLVTPNQREFEAAAGPCRDLEELCEKGGRLIETHELDGLLITRGDKGMTLLRRSETPYHLKAQAREVFDVTGAGDTVIAVMATAIGAGVDWHEAAAIANIAAGIVVGKLGTATASCEEINQAVSAGGDSSAAILDRRALADAVGQARLRNQRIVMTNGCFDILHAGHIRYLEQARRYGDRLVVAINDDASVGRLKGSTRPVNPLSSRMRVLAALECVDWVVAFQEDTPEALICDLKPDILVKGGDYRPEQIAGSQCVLDNGGEVIVVDYIEGHSTSDIIDRIRTPEDMR